ncbi:O-antigen ligase [Candidatus Electrothrix marina]|uniref:O-antigen ligase n=1 Tax=Candidatus Electrothrix marina TaxID=1859130 RepID=A0A444J3U8_9BACT|nr:O-antigen ligase [Candidatus Electrothrix marina]
MMMLLVFIKAKSSGKIKSIRTIQNNNQLKKYILFYAIMIVGIPFSVNKGMSFNFVTNKFLPQVLYFLLFVSIITKKDDLEKILFCVCCSNFFYALFSLMNSGYIGGRFSFGSMFDANDLAHLFISQFPLAIYFLGEKQKTIKRIFAALTIGLSVVVSLMTGSRGGLIGLFAVAFILFFTPWSPLKMTQKLLVLVILIAAVLTNISKIDTDRFSSILNPKEDYNVTGEEGRLALWGRGITLTLSNPVTGVGVSCFPNAIGMLRLAEGGIRARWQAPHNSYVEVLTEMGAFAFLVFIVMIVNALRTFTRYARSKRIESGSRSLEFMSQVMLLGFSGHLVTAFFLSLGYSLFFTLFFAFSLVLQNLCENSLGKGVETKR